MDLDNERHSIDAALRRIVGHPEPSPEALQRARHNLQQAMSEPVPSPRQGRGLNWRIAVSAAVAVAITLALILQPSGTSPAAAALLEIARIAEQQDPVTAPDTSFIYIRSESTHLAVTPRADLGEIPYDRDLLVYLQPRTREQWIGNEGTVQIRTTNLAPIFFRPDDEAVYYAAGLDALERIGETITNSVDVPLEEWPTDIDQLDEAIRDRMTAGRGLPTSVEYLDVALDIHVQSFSNPQLRSIVLSLIAGLDGLTHTEQDGTHTFTIEYTDRGVATTFTFSLDGTGSLLHTRVLNLETDPTFGIPANTAISEVAYEIPIEVDSLNSP